jgi:hypothetical protein
MEREYQVRFTIIDPNVYGYVSVLNEACFKKHFGNSGSRTVFCQWGPDFEGNRVKKIGGKTLNSRSIV